MSYITIKRERPYLTIARIEMQCRIKYPDRSAGDTHNPIIVHFEDDAGRPLDLSSVDHVQILAKVSGATSNFINEEMTISDATGGIAQYTMTSTEANTNGDIEMQFMIYHTLTSIEPMPPSGSVYLKVKEF